MTSRFLFVQVMRRYRDFRFLLTGSTLRFLGWTIDMVLRGWLVLELTNSPMTLAVVEALRFLPMIFGGIAGVISDRLDKRKIMIYVDVASALLLFLMGLLITTGRLEINFLLLITFLSGFLQVLSQTTRNVLTSDLVNEQALTAAVALTMFSMTAMGFVGSTMVAMVVNTIGIVSFYYIAALLVAINAILVSRISTSERRRTSSQTSSLKELIEGLTYVKNKRNILALQLIAAIVNMFLFPQIFMLMPLFAQKVLILDASGYAWMSAALRMGSLTGTFTILYLGRIKRRGLLTIITSSLWGVLLLIFSAQNLFPLSLLILICVGSLNAISMQMIQVLLLTYSSKEMVGRVMGVRMQAVVFLFVGDLVWGYVANTFGAQITMGISSFLNTVFMVGIIFWATDLRKLE